MDQRFHFWGLFFEKENPEKRTGKTYSKLCYSKSIRVYIFLITETLPLFCKFYVGLGVSNGRDCI